LIEHQGKAILIDCGEGTQIALKESGCKINHLNLILFTHFHADHIAGLPGLLLTLGNYGKKTPLTLIGPSGLKDIFNALTVIAPVIPYPIEIIELKGDKNVFEIDGAELMYASLTHSIPCYGYSIIWKRKPIFNPQKANKLGVPKKFFRTLHTGMPVRLDDGRIIDPQMVLDGLRNPIKICYCTDTSSNDTMVHLAKNADLFICEGMHGEREMQKKFKEKGHMLFHESAYIAKKACVKELWLTHYSPALRNPDDYVESAKEIFPCTNAAYDGMHKTLP